MNLFFLLGFFAGMIAAIAGFVIGYHIAILLGRKALDKPW